MFSKNFRILELPVVKQLIQFLKQLQLPGFQGFSVFDLLEMYAIGLFKGALATRAGSISFSFFMALFPFLLFVLNLIPFVPIQNFDASFLAFIESLLPESSLDFFVEIYTDIKQNRRGGLLSSSFLLSIILIGNGVNAILGGFSDSYNVLITRHFVKQYLFALLIGLLLSIVLIIAVSGFVFFEVSIIRNLSESGILDNQENILLVGKYTFFIALAIVSTSLLYYFGTAEKKQVRFFSPGAFMTSILFIATTYLFGIYIDNFSNYNELYGSIGALLILMLYIWLNAIILLLGFELNAAFNRLNKKH
jgi:membrane protein